MLLYVYRSEELNREMPSKSLRKLKIGFLGIAHVHAEAYARALAGFVPNAELVGVYDRDEKLGREFAARHGAVFNKTPEEILSRADGVIVTSENAFHHPLAIKAARAGKHILCEKPIALTLEDSREMKREAEKAGVKFQMCYVMRYHTVASVVKELLEEGRVGDILALVGVNKLNSSMTSKNWFSDKQLSGGGAVIDHTVHLADMMRWYTGSEVREVYCEIGRRINPRLSVEDAFLTTAKFENGVTGHIDGSWSYPAGYHTWGDVTLEILGSKGVLFLDAFRQNIYFTGTEHPNDRLRWEGYGCDANTEMIKGFVDSISMDTRPIATADDGIRGLQITLASYESAGAGKVIRLPGR